MHIFVHFVLPVQTQAEAQTKLQELKQALADAQILPERVQVGVIDRQIIDYSKITVTEK